MKIEVVTPEKPALSADVDELVAPGVRGEFGILPGHAPFVSALRPGVLVTKKGAKRQVLAVGSGFAEVDGHDKIVVLTQSAALAEDIDTARVQKELADAEQALKDFRPDGGASRAELEARRDWAQARLDARARA